MNWTIPLWGRQITRHTNSFTPLDQIPSFESIICNAELLISYAANAGIQLDDNDIKFLASAVEEYKTTGKHHTTSSIADVLCIYSRVASRLPIDPPTLIQFFFPIRLEQVAQPLREAAGHGWRRLAWCRS